MITDLDGGDPPPDRGRAKRAVSIVLAFAALVGYGALTWPAPSGAAPAAVPDATAASASARPLFDPLDTAGSGVVVFSCAWAPRGVMNVYMLRPGSIPVPVPPAAAAPVGQVWLKRVTVGSASGDGLEVERCAPDRSPARDLFVP